MKGLDRRKRPLALIGVRNGLGLLEGLLARTDRPGDAILVELGGLRLPPARGNVFRRDRNRLDAGLGDGKRRGWRAQRLEANLMKGVGEQPAFEVNAVFARRVFDPAAFRPRVLRRRPEFRRRRSKRRGRR